MERAAALKKLTKLLGKTMGYRVDPKAPTPEEREAARVALLDARAGRDTINKQREERYKAILAADSEYQALRAAHSAAQKRVDAIAGTLRRWRFTVGRSNGIFFEVKAEGDSWEEVIEKLTKEKTP